MEYLAKGYLKARAFTASEALPVPEAIIRIKGAEEANGGIDYSVITGSSGETEIIELPTPDGAYSLSPNSPEQAFATYNVEVSHGEFYPKKLANVSVFAGIVSLLPIELIPDSGLTRDITPPSSTNFSIIQENEELE